MTDILIAAGIVVTFILPAICFWLFVAWIVNGVRRARRQAKANCELVELRGPIPLEEQLLRAKKIIEFHKRGGDGPRAA